MLHSIENQNCDSELKRCIKNKKNFYKSKMKNFIFENIKKSYVYSLLSNDITDISILGKEKLTIILISYSTYLH